MAQAIDSLIAQLAKLPGIGSRSARRIALQLVRRKQLAIPPLVSALTTALEQIRECSSCHTLDESDPCTLCTDPRRDTTQICVVEDVQDLWAIERSHLYKGLYHVLGGTLSAIDGRGPDKLHIDSLIRRVSAGGVNELILATNATVEGQTTAHYITDRLEGQAVRISRLAQGIPMGGELDYLDDGTLGAALKARLPV